jgi:uncharacterized RmlC-like cupin family protein
MFQTTSSGSEYAATLRLQLTQSEKDALACVDQYLELDFRVFGFTVPGWWDGYSVSTDIPGAIHDTAVSDSSSNPTPGVTRIKVSSLAVNHEYYATVNFSGIPLSGSGAPRVSFEWVPSYWATSGLEGNFCTLTRAYYGDAMCIFSKTRAYLSHGYNNNVSLIFDGYRIWQFGPSSPTGASPPSTDTAPPATVQNYKLDRTILYRSDGTIYVMAGGAKFYFSSMGQISSLGYSTAGMTSLSMETANTIPDVPQDGTILRSGGGQVYVVAGGAKFNFGSMAEYYGQGYTDAQMINVPQGALDAIGDAPGNRPSDGVILQHPDGRLFVMSGGVKFYFGSMTEFSSLGYATSSIQRVSGAALDAIPTASSTSPPRDRTILRSGGGQIYVMAGGAKFHYGSMAEYMSLGAQDTNWVNVPQGSLDAIGDAPGNIPRNGTVLRSGGGQVYVVAGGAKFYFGSTTEYHNQGYTDAQMINVPQGPLDLLGDAPGNMPKNGTVVHRNDGSIFVITGGVRWAFGSMAQYYQLGYAYDQLVRVSWAPLDGIADASASHLPANGSLLQGSDATVWVMKDGVRRSFTGAQQVTDLGYSWSNLIRVPDGQLSGIPSGGNL